MLPRVVMAKSWKIYCESPELAIDLRRDCDRIGLLVECETSEDVWTGAASAVDESIPVGIAATSPPTPDQWVALSERARKAGRQLPVALVGPEQRARALAHDLGVVAVGDTGPLLAAMRLLDLEVERPWSATTKGLSPVDRVRLGDAVSHRSDGELVRCDDGLIGHTIEGGKPQPLGTPGDVAAAMYALRAAHETGRPRVPSVEGVDKQAVMDVILGPPRALSDPASKAAIAPYDVALPVEELCTTPSRAAAEAARIGFPVRMSLASPDLRVWEVPELATNEIDSAAGVREAYRQLMAFAEARLPSARLLGVTVGAATVAHALLRARLEPLESGLVLLEIGFADAHGTAADDVTQTILPTTAKGLERVLGRLRGSSLLLHGNAAERKHAVTAIGDVLMRLAAFVHDWQVQVLSIEVNPLALLVSGEIEVREVCVSVGDAFSRSMELSS